MVPVKHVTREIELEVEQLKHYAKLNHSHKDIVGRISQIEKDSAKFIKNLNALDIKNSFNEVKENIDGFKKKLKKQITKDLDMKGHSIKNLKPNGFDDPKTNAATVEYVQNMVRTASGGGGGGGGGVTDFLGLSDTPANYVGEATNVVRVNAGETALEFAAAAGGGDVTGPAGATDNAIARYDGATGKLLQNSGVTIDDNDNVVTPGYMSNQNFTDSNHYTGFPDRSLTSVGWNDGTYTLTLTATNDDIWIDGVAYNINSLSLALTAPQEAATDTYWFWVTAPGGVPQLNCNNASPGFDKCLVATVYWNTTTSLGIHVDERHWFGRDKWMHEYLHETFGARYAEGLGGTFNDTTLAIEAGEFYDEDLEHETVRETTAKVLYHNGDADWAWDVLSTPYKVVNPGVDDTLYYNNVNALATVTNNRFTCSWVFISADQDDSVHIYIDDDEYVNIADAREALPPARGALTSPEDKLIYKVIYKNVGGTPTYIEAEDFRASAESPGGITTDHGSLSNLDQDHHELYLLADGTRALSGAWSMGDQAITDVLFTDKIKFTQVDGNEYIDSLADGYLDLAATTEVRAVGPAFRVQGDLYVGNNAAVDPVIVFDGDTNDGQITFNEDEDTFSFSSPISTGVWNGTDIAVEDGGTGRGTATAYSVICAGTTATGIQQNVSGLGTATQVLTSNGADALPTWEDAGGGGGTPGGADTQVQYNDGGAFGGDANWTWDKTNLIMTMEGKMELSYLDGNVVLGEDAGLVLDSGSDYNILIGYQVGQVLKGDRNILIGRTAGKAMTTSADTTVVGDQAAAQITSGGSGLVAIGDAAMSQVIGVGGAECVAVGRDALKYCSGMGNVGVGKSAGDKITTGVRNTCISNSSGGEITEGSYNLAFGYNSMGTTTTGDYNLAFGFEVDLQDGTASSQLTIGNLIFANGGFGEGTTVGIGSVGIKVDPPSANASLYAAGAIGLTEITTPTADANYGKIYTKTDDKLYFQDGAGAEHEIAFV